MKLFLDERCLVASDLLALLSAWREIADFAKTHAPGLSLHLDRRAVEGRFLSRFNAIGPSLRQLFRPILFGSELVSNWRDETLCADVDCRLETEEEPVRDCAVCMVYESRKYLEESGILGHRASSYSGREMVAVHKLSPPESPLNVVCGTTITDFTRIARGWECLRVAYDRQSTRPPRDHETVLGHEPERFMYVRRFERNGRRKVYRELATNRFFYVDNLHFGAAAHLEVFDSNELHLGTADLAGVVDLSTLVPGRRILW
ncbi:MAG: hypothetical protein JNN01_07410 [Opitutaceae bacterium]|nr:hypothetical protein [Opitutaceae bacterium]